MLGGTGVGWAFAVMMLQKSSTNTDPNQVDTGFSSTNSQIFVHVAFGVISLAQFVLLERLIFRVRAERYAFKHPGEMLRRGGPMNASMPMVRRSPRLIGNGIDEDFGFTGAVAAPSASNICRCSRAKRCSNWRCGGRPDSSTTASSLWQNTW